MKKYSLLLILIALFSFGARAAQTPVTLASDGNGGWFIDMPAKGTATSVADAAVLTLTAEDLAAGKNIFKVYDDGGQYMHYPNNYYGYLIITLPEGYRIQLNGSYYTENNYDYIRVYDGTTDENKIGEYCGNGTINSNLRSSTNSILLYLSSDGSSVYWGFDFKATAFTTNTLASVNGIDDCYLNPVGSLSYTVTDIDGNEVEATNYTAVLTLNGTPVGSASAAGDYKLTVTGNDPYTGHVERYFSVLGTNLTGAGTEANPYLINNANDWDLFAERVSKGDNYNDKYVRLEQDITVSMMAGSRNGHSFKGTFLGNNKTLTFNASATDDYCAPFRFIDVATIRDLNVAGTISTAYRCGAGLVGVANGICYITNCVSTVEITSTFTDSREGFHGGFLGVANRDSNVVFNTCIFAGKLLGGNSTANGGFAGSVERTGKITTAHCLFAPAQLTMSTTGSYTIGNNTYGGSFSYNGTFYTTAFGTVINSTYLAYTQQPAEFNKIEFTYNATNYYSTFEPVFAINAAFPYTGSVISVPFTVSYHSTDLVENDDYTYTITPSEVLEIGTYTITITGQGIYAGTATKDFQVIAVLSGDGTWENPYHIYNDDDWEIFVSNVNVGGNYSGQYVRLENDITVTTPAGSVATNQYFAGTFLGNNKTMTLNLINTASSATYYSPFRYVKGATIKDLNIAGQLTSASYYSAGLVGYSGTSSTSYIQNCTSTAVITSTRDGVANCSGFVGCVNSKVSISDCIFAGKLLGTTSTTDAGFIGYSSSYSTQEIQNCMFIPSEVTMNETNSKTFSQANYNNIVDSYYFTPFGEAQGSRIVTEVPSNEIYKAVTAADQNNYYAIVDVTGVDLMYMYTGSVVTITPSVTFGSTVLVKDTDYTVVIRDSGNQQVNPANLINKDNYTLTLTGIGSYLGTKVINFRIADGENLNGYVFETGDDSEGHYYMINSSKDFENLAGYVNSGLNLTSEKRFKQTADITASTMVGTSQSKSFQGVYDGQGFTITANLYTTENVCGVFRYVNNAVIKNLHMAGTINTSAKFAGGIASVSYGTTTFANCLSTVAITSILNYTQSTYHGGLVAENNGTMYVTNCEFAGKLLGENARQNSGFVCLNNGATVYYTDCLFAPTQITMSYINSANYQTTGNSVFTRVYYLTTFGTVQGLQAYTTAPAANLYKVYHAVDGNDYYSPCEITNMHDLYAYTGSAINVAPVIKYNNETLTAGTDYSYTITPSAPLAMGDYTITINGMGDYTGSATFAFSVAEGVDVGDGYVFVEGNDDNTYYAIANEKDMKRLAAFVNSGHTGEGLRFKQTANITLTEEHTAIGTEDHYFRGSYDGDNKTISGLYINKPQSDYQGLFGHTNETTIKNVIIVNCDITGKERVGGVIGYGYDTWIRNCSVSGAIKTSNGVHGRYHGGIVGYSWWYEVNGCVNTASVTGDGDDYGGIAGHKEQYDIVNCFNYGIVEGTSYVGSIVGQIYASNTVNNYHIPSTTGGVGSYNSPTGTDRTGAEVMFTITAGENTEIVSATPITNWNSNDYYKNGTAITLDYDLPAGQYFDHYIVSNGAISNSFVLEGEHILHDVTDNVTITGSYSNKINIDNEAVSVHVGIIPYTGSVINVTPVVTRFGVTLVEGTDYTFTIDPATVQALGDYTMTVTGIGDYTGTKIVNFTVAEPTLIHNAEDWNSFAADVNAGTNCDGYYKLADDFDNSTAVQTTVGTSAHPFAGYFDGNGKTLNVAIYETSTNGTAPFREIANATIKNLTVSGSVTGKTNAAGLVGILRSGDNSIDNCVVNTSVTCNTGGDRNIGGVVGNSLYSTLSISNTVFAGTLNNYENYAGGLLGWSEGSILNITNCLVTNGKTYYKFHPIAIRNNGAVMNVNVNGAFYSINPTLTNEDYIAATGTKVYEGAQATFCKKEYTFNETDYYSTEEPVIGNVDNAYAYTGSVIAINPAVTYNNVAMTANADFTYAVDPAEVIGIGEYTLTITGNGVYAGTFSQTFHVLSDILAGNGTEDDPYIIASSADWEKFANNINIDAFDFSGCYVKLMDNINMSIMAGVESCGFAGNFNGDGNTITMQILNHSYTLATGESEGAQGIGLFNFVGDGCNIHDLNVDGTIVTANKYAGSIIAFINEGPSYSNRKHITLTNCRSSVSITSTVNGEASSGGLIGATKSNNNLNISNCVFEGKFISNTARMICGLAGYQFSSTNTEFTDCLVNADVTELTTYNGNFYTICRYGGSVNFIRSYYITAIGTPQGIRAYTSANVPATPLYGQITAADGNTYYVGTTIEGIDYQYAYTGNTININPTVSITNESVAFVEDTDYELSYTYYGNPVAEVNAIGSYILTISSKDGGKCKGAFSTTIEVYAPVPTDLTWSSIDASSVTMTWTDNQAANWTIEISDINDFSHVIASKDVTATTATFDGLDAETSYYVRVKSVYGESSSNWSTICTVEPSNKISIGYGLATAESLPTNIYYRYTLSEQIYTAEEIGCSGTILSIDFHCNANRVRNNFDIYMMNTDKASFSNGVDWVSTNTEGVVHVFNGTVNFKLNQWATIVLDTPFEYDSNKNLLIIVDDNHGSYDGQPRFRAFTSTSNKAISVFSDSQNFDPADPTTFSGSTSYNRSQIRLRMGDKVFTTTGDWDVASNWTPAGVPTLSDNVGILADVTIKNDVEAFANTITVAGNNTITIEDGGQLKHNNADVTATMEKEITGYTGSKDNYYLIASPMASNLNVSTGTNLAEGDFDLYYFDQSQNDMVWRNYEASAFTTLNNGKGYLYANSADKTATLTGQLKPSNLPVEVDLDYSTGKSWTGWNLIGNPFACNAYLTNSMAFYKMNAEGTELEAALANTAISPLEGVFVQATGESQKATFTKEAPVTSTGHGNLNIQVAQVVNSRNAHPATDNAIIRFGEGGTLEKFSFREGSTKVYIPQDNKDYAVVNAEDKGEMPVNFKAEENGTYALTFNSVSTEFSYLHLIDNKTGNDVDLLETPSYSFEAHYTDYASRFKLVFAIGSSVEGNDFGFIDANGNFVIFGIDGQATLQLVDVTGRILSTENFSGSYSKAINEAAGVYMMRLIQGKNVRTQKIVVR